ncbi:MAG: hypothetical protein NZM43_00265 [Saprospiraceae bacterium]|nr:hypothetical protein [Saprospiraceae bacterium]MDW8482734.1 hypothetical protein [Saprospiraceae bacterium]
MLRIAISPNPVGHWQGQRAGIALQAANIAYTLFEHDDPAEHVLARGDADAVVCWLCEQPPLKGDETVAIAAIVERLYPFDMLLWRTEATDRSKDFFLKEGAALSAATTLQRWQIAEFRPDLQWENLSPYSLVQALLHLRTGEIDALVVAEADLHAYGVPWSDFSWASLHPCECTPMAGQGALALLVRRNDIPTRRMLQRVHRPDISALTNVERRFWRDWQEQYPHTIVGVYVERDMNRAYHFFAAIAWPNGQIRRGHISHSTYAELAEHMFRNMHPNPNT